MLRNVASQKWRVYAWDVTTGLAKTGDAANISAHIQKDDAAGAATNDAAPSEVDATNQPGYYDFDLTQAESAAAKLSLSPKSATANIQVVACPPVVYTRPQHFSVMGVESDGDLTKVNTLDGHTPQTTDHTANIASILADTGTDGVVLAANSISAAATAADYLTELRTALFGADVDLDVDAMGKVRVVEGTGSGEISLTGGLLDWNPAWDAEVESESNDALVALHLDHLLAVTYDPAAKPGAADALLNELVESDAGVSRFTANALEQGPSGGGGVADWTADERTAIRSILGIPASGTTPDNPSAGILADLVDGGRLDQLLDAAKENTDYPGDFIHISAAGSAGTTLGVNGTARNPVTTVASARTIAIAAGRAALKGRHLEGFTVSTGSLANYTIDVNGGAWTIDNAVSLSGTKIYSSGRRGNLYGPTLGQVDVETSTVLQNLYVSGIILNTPGLTMIDCGLSGDVTDSTGGPNASARPILENCYNFKGDGSAVTFNLSSGGHWHLLGWYGDLETVGMGAGQEFYCNGWGKLTIDASCTGGTIKHTSHVEIVDNASGAVTTELISEPSSINDITSSAQADIRTAVGLAAANLDTHHSTTQAAIAALNDFDPATDQVIVNDFTPTALTELRTYLHGSDVAADMDVNGRIRIVDGTGAGEINTSGGNVSMAAADLRAALGLAAANLDTQFSNLSTSVGDVPTAAENANAYLDLADAIELNITPRMAMRAMAAKAAGLVSGAQSGTEVLKGIGQSAAGTTRATATVDEDGNINWSLNLA